jgi:peptidoglycan/xylan/chitin deacetylase (PgdA/CDA1 family)
MSAASQLVRRTYALSRYLGINQVLRYSNRRKLLVLCYHGVVAEDHAESDYLYRNTVSLREFREQLRVLNRCFRPISADDLIDHLDGRRQLPAAPVLVTFDDGYRNNLTLAADELERQGVPAVFHVTTGYVGTQRILWPQELNERILQWPHETLPMPQSRPDLPLPQSLAARIAATAQVRSLCKALPDSERRAYCERLRQEELLASVQARGELFEFLSWDEVRTLQSRSFEIGSHTVEHPILTRLTETELARELQHSKAAIERELQTQCRFIAFPNGGRGDFSPAVIEQVRRAGYRVGFSLMHGINRTLSEPLAIDRVNVPGLDPTSVFHARISGLFTIINRLR